MNQWNETRGLALSALAVAAFSFGFSVVPMACQGKRSDTTRSTSSPAEAPATSASPAEPDAVPHRASNETVGSTAASVARDTKDPVSASAKPSPTAADTPAPPSQAVGSGNEVTVKRFVVTSGIEQREPIASEGPLIADGTPVYAFAELVNRDPSAQQVRITFERKDSAERVGNAVLDVPANVPRHRTWANTRNIRQPGPWEAVLSSNDGKELARTSFEVAPATLAVAQPRP